MIRPVIFSLLLFYLLLLAETLFFSNITILGYKAIPDLILLAMVFISIQNGSIFGEIMGFCSGLLLDFLTIAPFGLNCLVRTIIGFLFGFFRHTINTDMFIVRMGIGLVATVIKALILLGIRFLFPGDNFKVYGLFSLAFRTEVVANIFCAPVLFFLMSICKPLWVIKAKS